MAKGKKSKPQKKAGASSSAAAGLLQGSGFVGFDAFAAPTSTPHQPPTTSSQLPTPFSAGLSPSAFYTGGDSDFASAFKIVLKKDSTTKAKGLQALEALLTSRAAGAEIRACLSHWMHLYGDLSRSNSRAVRDHTAAVLAVFVAKVPKALRRNQAHILPQWLLAAFDPDGDISRRNRASLRLLYGEDSALCGAVEEAWQSVLRGIWGSFRAGGDTDMDREERRKVCALRAIRHLAEIGLKEEELRESLSKLVWQSLKVGMWQE